MLNSLFNAYAMPHYDYHSEPRPNNYLQGSHGSHSESNPIFQLNCPNHSPRHEVCGSKDLYHICAQQQHYMEPPLVYPLHVPDFSEKYQQVIYWVIHTFSLVWLTPQLDKNNYHNTLHPPQRKKNHCMLDVPMFNYYPIMKTNTPSTVINTSPPAPTNQSSYTIIVTIRSSVTLCQVHSTVLSWFLNSAGAPPHSIRWPPPCAV